MPIKVKISPSSQPDKKYTAVFSEPPYKTTFKTVHFGSKGSSTYLNHNDNKIKDAYISRHAPREDWSFKGRFTPGALSRWILWNKKTLNQSLADYKKRFYLV